MYRFLFTNVSLKYLSVIAGESMGVKSPVRTRTPTYYLDFEMSPGSSFEQDVPEAWTTFVYTLEGKVKFGE
jgi:redox-sensitive bicupin YhaK (pirin superfamily)